jgi:hypothetical protein
MPAAQPAMGFLGQPTARTSIAESLKALSARQTGAITGIA